MAIRVEHAPPAAAFAAGGVSAGLAALRERQRQAFLKLAQIGEMAEARKSRERMAEEARKAAEEAATTQFKRQKELLGEQHRLRAAEAKAERIWQKARDDILLKHKKEAEAAKRAQELADRVHEEERVLEELVDNERRRAQKPDTEGRWLRASPEVEKQISALESWLEGLEKEHDDPDAQKYCRKIRRKLKSLYLHRTWQYKNADQLKPGQTYTTIVNGKKVLYRMTQSGEIVVDAGWKLLWEAEQSKKKRESAERIARVKARTAKAEREAAAREREREWKQKRWDYYNKQRGDPGTPDWVPDKEIQEKVNADWKRYQAFAPELAAEESPPAAKEAVEASKGVPGPAGEAPQPQKAVAAGTAAPQPSEVATGLPSTKKAPPALPTPQQAAISAPEAPTPITAEQLNRTREAIATAIAWAKATGDKEKLAELTEDLKELNRQFPATAEGAASSPTAEEAAISGPSASKPTTKEDVPAIRAMLVKIVDWATASGDKDKEAEFTKLLKEFDQQFPPAAKAAAPAESGAAPAASPTAELAEEETELSPEQAKKRIPDVLKHLSETSDPDEKKELFEKLDSLLKVARRD